MLLKGSLAAGALFGLYGVAGCAPAPAQPASQPSAPAGTPAPTLAAMPTATPAATPTSQAASSSVTTLRTAHGLSYQGRESLDPHARSSFRAVNDYIYDRLTRYATNGMDQELALGWEPNKTATEWVFTLRKDVKFHDGTPFTARDVIYSYQRIGDPKLRSSLALYTGVIDLAAMTAIDDYTVRFPLKRPHADFPFVAPPAVPIIAKDSGESVVKTGNGTGSFKLKTFAPEGKTVLVANDAYWGEKAKLAEIELVPIPDGNARANALLAGQVDFIDQISRSQAALVERNSNYVYQVVTGPLSFSYFLVMRPDAPPFNDVRVRKAMKLVVDRALMLQTTVQGDGIIGNDTLIYPGNPVALKEAQPFDIKQAKALLAEAGYANGLDVTLTTNSGIDIFSSIAVTYKEMAAAAGINVTIKPQPGDSYYNEIAKAPFFIDFSASPSAPVTFDMSYRPGGPFNDSQWDNKEVVGLLDKAFAELDDAKRADIYRDLQRLIKNEGCDIVLFFAGIGRAFQKSVKGLDPNHPIPDWKRVFIDRKG
jgi:peptide/nickel transport system substrate-binding protein